MQETPIGRQPRGAQIGYFGTFRGPYGHVVRVAARGEDSGHRRARTIHNERPDHARSPRHPAREMTHPALAIPGL